LGPRTFQFLLGAVDALPDRIRSLSLVPPAIGRQQQDCRSSDLTVLLAQRRQVFKSVHYHRAIGVIPRDHKVVWRLLQAPRDPPFERLLRAFGSDYEGEETALLAMSFLPQTGEWIPPTRP